MLSQLLLFNSVFGRSQMFEIRREYELPPYTSAAVVFAFTDESAYALTYADSNLGFRIRHLLRYSSDGAIQWKLDIGTSGPIPIGGTSQGVFFGARTVGIYVPGMPSIDAAIFTEAAGTEILPPLPDQHTAYLRASSDDGPWVGGDISFFRGEEVFVIWTPDRTSIRTGPFLSLDFKLDGTAFGIDTSARRAATWTREGGVKLFPEPPIEVAVTAARRTTESGLTYVIAANPEGSAQRVTQMIFDGTNYRILENTDIGETEIRDINNNGWAVGLSDGTRISEAVVWIDGAMYDLNTLVPNLGDVKLYDAQAINDRGQIAVIGIDSHDMPHAYLLSPTPEPTTLAAFVMWPILKRRRPGN